MKIGHWGKIDETGDHVEWDQPSSENQILHVSWFVEARPKMMMIIDKNNNKRKKTEEAAKKKKKNPNWIDKSFESNTLFT